MAAILLKLKVTTCYTLITIVLYRYRTRITKSGRLKYFKITRCTPTLCLKVSTRCGVSFTLKTLSCHNINFVVRGGTAGWCKGRHLHYLWNYNKAAWLPHGNESHQELDCLTGVGRNHHYTGNNILVCLLSFVCQAVKIRITVWPKLWISV